MKAFFQFSVFLLLSSKLSIAQQIIQEISTPPVTYTVEEVVNNLTNPWGMAFLPDGAILLTEKNGTLIHFKNGERNRIEGLPEILVLGQGGLLDIKLHPEYEKNKWIYFSYSSPLGNGEGGNTAIMRARLRNNTLVDQQLLYKATPNSTAGAHWGARLEFDKNNYLYFSIGDRYDRDQNPQDIKRDGGKIYRLKDDGSIPEDNPFVDRTGAKKAIYSYGHRNPQGMTMHPQTDKLWIHEHGPKGGDEINIIEKGKNYGWPLITYGRNYSGTEITDKTAAQDMEQPLFYWIPSIAPCGMTFVTSDKYPQWKGDLLIGSLKFGYLEHLVVRDNKVVKREKLLEGIGRVRNVCQAPNGFIYVAVEGKGIIRLVPN